MRVAELEKQLLQREKELESIKVPATGSRPDCHWVPGSEGCFSFLSHIKSLRVQLLIHDLEARRCEWADDFTPYFGWRDKLKPEWARHAQKKVGVCGAPALLL